MRISHGVLFLLAITVGAPGCSGGEPAVDPAAEPGAPVEDIGEILAEVGDVKVGSKEFEAAAQRTTPANGESLSDAEKKEILDKLVVEKILYIEAKKRNIDRDPKVQKVMINTLLRQDVYSSVRNSDFTTEQLQAYFDQHKDEFVVPEKVQVKRLFVKVGEKRGDAEAKAFTEELRKQIVADPEKFKDLATEHSEDPYRRRGGDLGFLSKEGKPGVDPAVVEKAFTLPVNQVSEVFLAGGGYNLVLVANKRERVERTFEQMKGSVLRKVKNEKYKVLYDEYVAKVRGAHTVKLYEDKLAAIAVSPARRMGPGAGPMPMQAGGAGEDAPTGGEGDGAPPVAGDEE